MKALILYDSRHGFTAHCLGLLAGELPPGVDLWPVRDRPGMPDWDAYDAIAFGGPVYFGRWAPRVTAFAGRHFLNLPRSKPLAAFVVSLSPKAAALKYFAKGLPHNLKGRLRHVACFGGSVAWNGLSWWEKLLLKRARGIETDMGNLDLEAIRNLAGWLTGQAEAHR